MSLGPLHGRVTLRPRDTVIGRRLRLVALTGAVLATVAVTPSAALAASSSPRVAGSVREAPRALRDTPTQTIDAKTDPDAAAKALNAGCADLTDRDPPTPKDCSLTSTSDITFGYGPSRILGDVLYNCADPNTEPDAEADTAVGVSDERKETTSLSESLSVKVSAGILGLESASVEAEVSSGQAESFATKVKTTNAVAVGPGYKGWTETQVLTASVTGDVYITQGIHLIEVKGIDLDFPGYTNAQTAGMAEVIYNGFSVGMNKEDTETRCDKIPFSGLGGVRHGAVRGGGAQFGPAAGTFKLTLCSQPVSFTASVRLGPVQAACATYNVTGPVPPSPRSGQATATLSRGGRTYAAGTDIGGASRSPSAGQSRPDTTSSSYRIATPRLDKAASARST